MVEVSTQITPEVATDVAPEVRKGREPAINENTVLDPITGNKVPLPGQLPAPQDRVFNNSSVEKPKRKTPTLAVKFGEVTNKNFEQLRILNYVNLPVVYSENFYEHLISMRRYSKLAYIKDVLVGAISCKEEIRDDGTHTCYIMTITVLKPYRRYGIGSQLLEKAIEECMAVRDVKIMTLNVQINNEQAIEFYKKAGFEIVKTLENYYTELDEPNAYVLEKAIN